MEATMESKITEYELLDHGVDASSYFPGVATTWSNFKFVQTGIGDTYNEALLDCIEMIAQCDDITSESFDNIEKSETIPDEQNATVSAYAIARESIEGYYENIEGSEEFEQAMEESELYYHVSIRYNLEGVE